MEYQSWPELSAAEKTALGQLYVPYFIFGRTFSNFLSLSLVEIGRWSKLMIHYSAGDACGYVRAGSWALAKSCCDRGEGKGKGPLVCARSCFISTFGDSESFPGLGSRAAVLFLGILIDRWPHKIGEMVKLSYAKRWLWEYALQVCS